MDAVERLTMKCLYYKCTNDSVYSAILKHSCSCNSGTCYESSTTLCKAHTKEMIKMEKKHQRMVKEKSPFRFKKI